MSNNYLVHYNKNHYPPGPKGGQFAPSIRGAMNSIGSSILRKKKKPVPPAADIKSRQGGSKGDNTKLSKDEKSRLMNSGSLEEINQNKNRLSNKELEFAINRIQREKNDRANLEKKLSDLNGPPEQTTMQKGAEAVQKMAKGITFKDLKEGGMSAWNFMAKIHNATATPDDKWFTFDDKGNPQANSDPASVIDLMSKGSVSDILKNKDKLTTEQLKDAVERQKHLEALQGFNDKDQDLPKGVLSDKEKGDIIEKGDYDKLSKNIDQFNPAQVKKTLDNYATKQANDKRIQDIDYENKKNNIGVDLWTDPKPQEQSKKGIFDRAKDAVNDFANTTKPVDKETYEQRLNQYEKQARSDAQSYRESSSSGPSASDLLRDLSTPSRPTDAVRDFVNMYASKNIPSGSKADTAITVANLGYDIYKQRKKKNY